MPIIAGGVNPNNNEATPGWLHRKLYVTDKNGVEHEIKSFADLQKIIAQMTPQEFEDWKARYRFAPIQNQTGNPNYMGTIKDIL